MATGDLLAAINTSGANLKAFQFQGFSSTVRSSFTTTSACFGITWHSANGNVIYGNANPTTSIKQGTGFTAAVSSSFDFSPGTITYDLHWDNVGGNLYAVHSSTKAYRFTGFSSTVGASFTTAAKTWRGIAWDQTNALMGGGDQKVYTMTGFTGTVASSFSLTNFYGGLTWDGTNLYTETEAGATLPKFNLHSGYSATITSSFTKGNNVNYFGIHYEIDAAAVVAAKRLTLLGVGL